MKISWNSSAERRPVWRPDGRALHPLDEAEAAHIPEEMREKGVEAVAVSLLFAFANPEHEARIGQMARERGLFVYLYDE